MEMTQNTLSASLVPEKSDSDASPDDGFPIEGEHFIDGGNSITATEFDASMQIMEDGDYPEDEEFE